MSQLSRPLALRIVLLSFVGGYVDTTGYMMLDGFFLAHVTGNLVTAAASLSEHRTEGAIERLAALIVFSLATGLTFIGLRLLGGARRTAMRALFYFEAVLVFLFALTLGLAVIPAQADQGFWPTLAAFFGGVAMAVQNAVMRECMPALAPTTVMTGNLTQVILDGVRLVMGTRGLAIRRRATQMAVALAAFLLGSLFSALAAQSVGAWGLALPVGALIYVARSIIRVAKDEPAMPGAPVA